MTRHLHEPVTGMLLETRNLRVDFGGVHAVDGIDFRMAGREVRAVIGPNGAGKTTFFNALTGVVRPSAGSIVFEGEDITRLSPRNIARRRLVRTFQISQVFPGLSVRDSIFVAAQARYGVGSPLFSSRMRADIARLAEEVIELLGLEGIAGRRVGDLSYGDQRVVEVAITMALDPKLLLLDEPTAGMSPTETDRIADLVRQMRTRVGIVIIEHDMEVVMGVADTISVLDAGRLIAEGPPDAIRRDPRVRAIYLGLDT
jgi:branched-chain amino acid transport system ATP-binding protein